MSSIDERVVAMSFENAKFEAGVKQTLSTLSKLNQSLKDIGAGHGLADIEKAASKINFSGASSAIDKLKAKINFSRETKSFSDLETASHKVTLSGLASAFEGVKARAASAVSSIITGFSSLTSRIKLPDLSRGLATTKIPNGASAFSEIERNASRVNFHGLTSAIDGISSHFSAMSVAATTAFATVVSRATSAGLNVAKSFSIGPVTQGLQEYTTNLNSIQTILANTQASGAGLKDVNAALQELNTYSDKTIYNFSEMAKNIGTFTAAGVGLKDSTAAIKGIANLAALSGSNSQQASTAMYQLSQAIAAGRVSLQDWNSVVNAGMGGTVFQRALANTAQAMGTLKDGAVKLKGPMKNVSIEGQSFRESITAKPGQKSWLTSDVLTKTLSQFTGDLSAAQIKAMGFNDQQIKAIQQTAKTAQQAATQVKTLGQVFDVAKETIGSGWSKTFQLLFGDFGEAKHFFTGMSNGLNNLINQNAQARNEVLTGWKKLGGRDVLIGGLKNALAALKSVLDPIKKAFREIFPAKTSKDLYDLTVRFRDLMEKLKIGPETAKNLKRTFAGFFAVIDIGKQIITGFLHGIGKLLGAGQKGSGAFLNFTGSIGDFLVSLDKALKKSGTIRKIFESIGTVLHIPIHLIGVLAGALGDLVGGTHSSEGISKAFDGMGKSLGPLNRIVKVAKQAWDNFLISMKAVGKFFQGIAPEVGNAISKVGDAINQGFQDMDFSKVFQVIETTLIGGIFLKLRSALGGGKGGLFNIDFGGGVAKSLKSTLGEVNTQLKLMQTQLKAKVLLEISAAIALLSAAVIGLSLVDSKKLASAMTAISIGFGQLVGAMALLGKMKLSIIQLPIIATGMIALAGAMILLSIAVTILSKLSWNEIAKGLAGVGGSLVAIGVGVQAMPASLGLIGLGLLPVAVALNIIALAMKQFGQMKWAEIGKGLLGVGGGLTAISLGVKGMGPSLILVGPGLIAVAFALTLISGAMQSFGNMDLSTIGKGLLGIAGSLTAIGLSVALIPPTVGLQAVGLIALAIALNGIALSAKIFATMSLVDLAKGLTAMGAALVVLAGGLALMSGAVPGSIALLAAAGAFAILVPSMVVLGKLKIMTIVKGLAAMGAAMVVIGGAGMLVAPGLVATGLAMAALGVGLYAAGAGIKLIAEGLGLMGSVGPKGIATMIAAITAFIVVVPKMAIEFAKGLVQILASLAALAPQIVASLVKIINSMLTVVIQSSPKLAAAMIAFISSMLKVVDAEAPKIIASGWRLFLNFIKGIKDHIGETVGTVGQIIVRFLSALAAQMPKITAAGANLLFKFLAGFTGNAPRIIAAAANAVAKFLQGLANNSGKVITAGVNLIVKFVSGVTKNLPRLLNVGSRFIIKLLEGIATKIPDVIKSAVTVLASFIKGIGENAHKLVDAGIKAIISFMHGLAQGIRDNSDEMGRAGADIGEALIEGLIRGILAFIPHLVSKVMGALKAVPNAVKKIFNMHSPSKVFEDIGINVMKGFIIGVGGPDVVGSAVDTASNFLTAFKDHFEITSPSKVMERLGKYVGEGFAKGLRGSNEDIKSAYTDLFAKLKDATSGIKQALASEHEQLKKLTSKEVYSTSDIEKILLVQNAIDQNNKALKKLSDTQKFILKNLADEKKLLNGLATAHQTVTDRLSTALDDLKDKIQGGVDAFKSFADQYSKLPDISNETVNPLAMYVKNLTKQIAATVKYKATLDQLRQLGLDDATYQKLLSEGPADQKFAEQLLAGGKTAIQSLNALDTQLMTVSAGLAGNAAKNLYQAGVDAAQGLVNGLLSVQAQIEAAMTKLAKAMVKAIKKELHIKSPSQVFAEMGRFTMQGLVEGINSESLGVSKAVDAAASNVVDIMSKRLSTMPDALSGLMVTEPVISPILDLTGIQEDAKKLAELTNVSPITAAASFGQASAISSEQAMVSALAPGTSDIPPGEVKFEQNNYSPVALTATEIYRQTKNQLAQVKNGIPLAS